eukprot:14004858-Ditylum_brightwellii.AAC.1
MEGKPVVVPINADVLNDDDKRKQTETVFKGFESVASPTIRLESLMTTLLIGAHGGRKFISFDVPGAFLQAEMA